MTSVNESLELRAAAVPRNRDRSSWLPMLVLPAATLLFIPAEWPRWVLMWSLALAIYVGCKWLTWRRAAVDNVPAWQHAGYLLAWPGLDAVAFLRRANISADCRPRLREWLFATAKFVFGIALVATATRLIPGFDPYFVGWIGMVGIIFTLHFGLFDLLSCAWRSVGIDARRLMDWPLLSESVAEFWGRRWNRAFRDLTHRFLFRPLTTRCGPRIALGLGFVFSGLVHELVITVPAGGGYGGPTLFFLIQGVAMFVERSAFGRRLGLGEGFRGRLFVACVMLLPVYFLFPPVFVERVIVPLLEFPGDLT